MLSKSCLVAPGRTSNAKGFLIPSVTHNFLQDFQKSHNPVPSPGSESEVLLFIVFEPGVPAAVLVAASTPPTDPLGGVSGDWDLPTSSLHFSE